MAQKQGCFFTHSSKIMIQSCFWAKNRILKNMYGVKIYYNVKAEAKYGLFHEYKLDLLHTLGYKYKLVGNRLLV